MTYPHSLTVEQKHANLVELRDYIATKVEDADFEMHLPSKCIRGHFLARMPAEVRAAWSRYPDQGILFEHLNLSHDQLDDMVYVYSTRCDMISITRQEAVKYLSMLIRAGGRYPVSWSSVLGE